mmetsp:Transcript_103229/g.301090  ORF Transcript_103229/g.301090 Transcript_103229/m.301090 type:complete len:243 (+) Transcript_103229:384-1112(+)
MGRHAPESWHWTSHKPCCSSCLERIVVASQHVSNRQRRLRVVLPKTGDAAEASQAVRFVRWGAIIRLRDIDLDVDLVHPGACSDLNCTPPHRGPAIAHLLAISLHGQVMVPPDVVSEGAVRHHLVRIGLAPVGYLPAEVMACEAGINEPSPAQPEGHRMVQAGPVTRLPHLLAPDHDLCWCARFVGLPSVQVGPGVLVVFAASAPRCPRLVPFVRAEVRAVQRMMRSVAAVAGALALECRSQ